MPEWYQCLVKAWDIVAYTFEADNICPGCIEKRFGNGSENAEDALSRVAAERGIDRQDESSFDSGDFPKVVFSSMVEDTEHCGDCHEEI